MKKTINELLERMDDKKVVNVAKIRENAQLKPMAKKYTDEQLKKKLEKTTAHTNRRVEQLAHIKFDKVEFTESETNGRFTQKEIDFIIQSAFRRAEQNHVHNKKYNKDKDKITAIFSNLDNKSRYIDKFRLYEEYDNCFNEFYCQVLKMIKKNNKIFVYVANEKLDRVKLLICKLAYSATNCIEKAIYEMAYYKSTKLKAEREFLKNATSIDDIETFVDIESKTNEYDYVNLMIDIRKMFTSSALEIIKLKLLGRTHREIADELSISTKTIQKTLNEIRAYLLDKKVEQDYIISNNR